MSIESNPRLPVPFTGVKSLDGVEHTSEEELIRVPLLLQLVRLLSLLPILSTKTSLALSEPLGEDKKLKRTRRLEIGKASKGNSSEAPLGGEEKQDEATRRAIIYCPSAFT